MTVHRCCGNCGRGYPQVDIPTATDSIQPVRCGLPNCKSAVEKLHRQSKEKATADTLPIPGDGDDGAPDPSSG